MTTAAEQNPASDMESNVEAVTETLKILSAPARLLALCQMIDGEKSVGELAELTGRRPTALSQHLALMRAHGIVKTRREGTSIYYSLASPEIAGLISYLHSSFCKD